MADEQENLVGAFVTIGADLAPLEQGVARAKELRDEADRLTATVRIVGDSTSLAETLAALPRSTAGSGVQLSIQFDPAATDAQVRTMVDRVREAIAREPVVIPVQVGNAPPPATPGVAPSQPPLVLPAAATVPVVAPPIQQRTPADLPPVRRDDPDRKHQWFRNVTISGKGAGCAPKIDR